MRIVLLSLLFAVVAADFDYNVSDLVYGPTTWATNYPTCGSNHQSPININTTAVSSNGTAVQFSLSSAGPKRVANLTYTFNGHVELLALQNRSISYALNGVSGVLLQLQTHTPSEHTIDGRRYDLEIHVVGTSDYVPTTYQTVFGFLFQVGPSRSAFLDTLIPLLPGLTPTTTYTGIPGFDFGTQFFNYNGSLTTPPCTENVNWMLSKTIMNCSLAQVQAFASILNNSRPIQPLNGRVVQSAVISDPTQCNDLAGGFTCGAATTAVIPAAAQYRSCKTVAGAFAGTACVTYSFLLNYTIVQQRFTITHNLNVLPSQLIAIAVTTLDSVQLPRASGTSMNTWTGAFNSTVVTTLGSVKIYLLKIAHIPAGIQILLQTPRTIRASALIINAYNNETTATQALAMGHKMEAQSVAAPTQMTGTINTAGQIVLANGAVVPTLGFPLSVSPVATNLAVLVSTNDPIKSSMSYTETFQPTGTFLLVRRMDTSAEAGLAIVVALGGGVSTANSNIREGQTLQVNTATCSARPVYLNIAATSNIAASQYCVVDVAEVMGILHVGDNSANRAYPGSGHIKLANPTGFIGWSPSFTA